MSGKIKRHVRPTSFPLPRPIREYRVDGKSNRSFVIFLSGDGRVYGYGNNSYGQLNISDIRDACDIAVSCRTSFFVRMDGTVVGRGVYANVANSWKNIVRITGGYDGIVGLKEDGTLVSAGTAGPAIDVSGLKDIVQISSCGYSLLALASDGTVYYRKNPHMPGYVRQNGNGENWNGIKAVEVQSTVYLSSVLLPDGSVISRGYPTSGYNFVQGRKDVASHRISAREGIALLDDGTLVQRGIGGFTNQTNVVALCDLPTTESGDSDHLTFAVIKDTGEVVSFYGNRYGNGLKLAIPNGFKWRDYHDIALLHMNGSLVNDAKKTAIFTRDSGEANFDTVSKFYHTSLHFKSGDSIACGCDDDGITLGNKFTIDFWAKCENWKNYLTFFSIGKKNSAFGLFTQNWNNESAEICLGKYNDTNASFHMNMDNEWHHYAVTYDGKAFNLYIDGKKKIDNFIFELTVKKDDVIRFGGLSTASKDFWFSGYIDEIRISDCVRDDSEFNPPEAPYIASGNYTTESLKDSYYYSLHRRDKKIDSDIATPNAIEYLPEWSKHKINFWIERPEVYSWIPCQETGDEMLGHKWNKIGDIKFDNDATKNKGDIGYGYLRVDNTQGKNSYLVRETDVTSDYGFSCWFRLASTSGQFSIIGSSGFNITATIIGGGRARIQLGSNVNNAKMKTVAGFNRTIGDYELNVWHHAFVYSVSGRFRVAIDGKWVGEESIVPEDEAPVETLGGWNNPTVGANKSIIDYCEIYTVKSKTPLWEGMSENGFRPPMTTYPFAVRGGRLYEHRFAPLIQDIVNPKIGCRIEDSVYGRDPFVDIENCDKEHQIIHITNVNNTPKDITGRTIWNMTNVYPKDIYALAPLDFHHGNTWGNLVKNNSDGHDIILGTSNFTFLIDLCLQGSKEGLTSGVNNQSSYIVDGERFALHMAISPDLRNIVLDCSTQNRYIYIKDVNFQIGKEYRVILQRRDGVLSAWVNGMNVLKDTPCTYNLSGRILYLCGNNTGNVNTTLNGFIRNIVIWDKALVDVQQTVKEIENIFSIQKKWQLDSEKAIFHGDLKKGANRWQFSFQ